MRKVSKYVLAVLCISSLAFSAGAFMKVNAAAPSVTSAAPGQPVDLTYAAEKALPAVVHIKYVQKMFRAIRLEISSIHSVSLATLAVDKAEHANRKCRLPRERLQALVSSSAATDISSPTTTW